MSDRISISLDLGSDSMKVVCAYRDGEKKEHMLKVYDPRYSDPAIPAVGYFDEAENKWRFGSEIGRRGERSFSTVVKIKELLSTISVSPAYYEKANKFPIFEFPITSEIPDSYYRDYGTDQGSNEELDKLFFEAKGFTPKGICERFFNFVYAIIAKFLKSELKASADEAEYLVIYPTTASEDYIKELRRLFANASGLGEGKISMMSSTKVSGMLAAYYDRLGEKRPESALLFDIGEERMSVTKFKKAVMHGENVFSVEGVSGHRESEKLGGNDIDKALVDAIERDLAERERFGGNARIQEKGLNSKNYLFMKSVKSAKNILGREFRSGEVEYPAGVPVNVVRDVELYENVTLQMFRESIGYSDGHIIAGSPLARIDQFIVDELSNEQNMDAGSKATRIYLSGGAAGTVWLKESVKDLVKKRGMDVEVKTFDSLALPEEDSVYYINSQDIFAYAPAIGGALVNLRQDKISVRLTKSYGIRVVADKSTVNVGNVGQDTSFYSILANMGSELDFSDFDKKAAAAEARNKTNASVGQTKTNYLKYERIDGKEYKIYYQRSFFLARESSDVMYVYSSYLTDSSVFPEDRDAPQDTQKFYKLGVGKGKQIEYFYAKGEGVRRTYRLVQHYMDIIADDRKEAGFCPRLYIPVYQKGDRDFPIRKDIEKTLQEEMGFKTEGGGNGERVCSYFRDKRHPIRKITVHNTIKNRFYVLVGVKIDREGKCTVFADNDLEKNKGMRADIEYLNPNGTVGKLANVPLSEIVVDFNSDITVETGSTAR